MQKSIYSLVLSDGIVQEIDRLAYLRGRNRSQLINEILAEYVSYITPEQRIRTAFARISSMLDGQESFRLMAPPSDTLLSLGSALLYKYNPTVRYSVELFRDGEGDVGEFRVSLRTQNATLTALLTQFYRLFAHIEHSVAESGAHWEDGRYFRPLRPKALTRAAAVQEITPEQTGELIADFIRTFDAALKAFFSDPSDPYRVEAVYRNYLKSHTVIL